MSRTYRTKKRTNEKVRDGKTWKCNCEWCTAIPWRNRRGLSIKEDLNLDSHEH